MKVPERVIVTKRLLYLSPSKKRSRNSQGFLKRWTRRGTEISKQVRTLLTMIPVYPFPIDYFSPPSAPCLRLSPCGEMSVSPTTSSGDILNSQQNPLTQNGTSMVSSQFFFHIFNLECGLYASHRDNNAACIIGPVIPFRFPRQRYLRQHLQRKNRKIF